MIIKKRLLTILFSISIISLIVLFANRKVHESPMDDILLLEQAQNRGIIISDNEVDNSVQQILDLTGQTEEELAQLLENRDSSIDELRESIRKEAAAAKLLEEDLRLSEISVAEEEINDVLGIEENLVSDDPLAQSIRDEVAERLLMIKKSALIKEYIMELNEHG